MQSGSTTQDSRRLGFGARLTVMIASLVLGSVALITSIVYVQYRNAEIDSVLRLLEGSTEANAQAFDDWLGARQDEMRYLASLQPAAEMEPDALEHLLERIAASQGHYDTIFVVDPDGNGVVGVDDNGEIMSRGDANDFQVPDRAWFQAAIGGDQVFSEPVVSRATRNRVSTVAVPIRRNGDIVGVMRGAVDLDAVVEQVRAMADDASFEIFLVDGDGNAVTDAPSLEGAGAGVASQAGSAVAAGEDGVGRYSNAAGNAVVGSYSMIPLIGWGLVMEQDESTALAEVQRIFWILLALASAILVVAIGASLGVVRSVTRTLGGDPNYAADAVRRVADGDMTTEIHLRQGDKDSLLASIATMQANLHRMLNDMKSHADEVASAATELTQINQETDAGIQRQRDQVSSAATAMNEMTATVEEVARNGQSAADGAQQATNEANDGKQVVTATVQSMETLSTQISDASDAMSALKRDSDNIGTVLQVIQGVAEQTNLLALNAAIEAARAGEQGRGFAVVADEVRTLANRTKESTSEIQTMIEQLQSGAERAEQAMVQSREQTTQSAEQAEKAGHSLGQITESVTSINDMIQQIASAAEQQSATAREINENIHAITEVADGSARSVVQSREASDSLAELAEKLRQMTHQFRL
ncbi:methyl-accepting chemotaxis protein [Aquisalimonas sp. 2447]|uniref:methyl-accepting chemotaxis protein n=1 Tax=Aquisalimonas sp. 2447 TaxID=2740807 RepID=UPI0014327E4E|nr:methyl-accepting chemotaxis protein [Aquisalimonas sp. 2447]QIT55639.1 methyl-accepting chemotaxis protein [Aquisalimonas sp. 2447]